MPTRRKVPVKEIVEVLREVNANLLGVVINRLTSQPGSYYNYRSYYYYRKTYDGLMEALRHGAVERARSRILKRTGWKEIISGRKVEKQKRRNPNHKIELLPACLSRGKATARSDRTIKNITNGPA